MSGEETADITELTISLDPSHCLKLGTGFEFLRSRNKNTVSKLQINLLRNGMVPLF